MRNAFISIGIVISLIMTMCTPFITALPTGPGPRVTPNHSVIKIASDAQFDASHGVVAGKGTASRPYIIENWTISAKNDNAILIRDTRAYFIIRNCSLYDGSSIGASGVLLHNVSNGTVRDSTFWNNENSIFTEFLNDTVILNNTVHDDSFSGIDIETGQNNTVASNRVYKELLYGFWIEKGKNDKVYGNRIHDCSQDGFVYFPSSHETVHDNIIYNNSMSGISTTLHDSTVYNNTVYGNGYSGILDDWSSNSTFSNNSIHDNTPNGLQLNSGPWNLGNAVIGNEIYANPIGLAMVHQDGIRIAKNRIHNNTDIGLSISTCVNVTMEDNNISGNGRGLDMTSDGKTFLQVTINDNWFVSNTDGIVITDYPGVSMTRNTLLGNKYGLGVDASGPDGYMLDIDQKNTIDGGPIVYLVGAGGGAIQFDPGYVGLVACDNVTVQGKNLSHNRQGALVAYSVHIHLKDNAVSSNRIGIDLVGSSRSLIEGNNISLSETGLRLLTQNKIGSDGNIVLNNDVHDCTKGIVVTGSMEAFKPKAGSSVQNNLVRRNLIGMILDTTDSHTVYKNDVRDNSEEGLQMGSTSWNLVDNNTIIGNGLGINITNTYQDTITGNLVLSNKFHGILVNTSWITKINNNMFSNKDNFLGESHWQVNWRAPKTPGPNIVGGPYFGGNYWSDYTGIDSDHDYIGDTNLPYRSVDYKPLVAGPAIMTDLTNGTPIENRTFSLNMSCAYRFGVRSANMSYSFDNGPWTWANMTRVQGDDMMGQYQASINIPWKAAILHYVLGSMTKMGGWGTLPQKDLVTLDLSQPSIVDLSGTPSTGDPFNLTFNVSDKGILAGASVTYNFDGSAPASSNVTIVSGTASLTVQVPPSAYKLYYNGTCWDRSFNKASVTGERKVSDNDPPVLTVMNGTPQTGRAFDLKVNATDNWGMYDVSVSYDFGHGNTSADMVLNGGLYRVQVMVPLNATKMHAVFTGMDSGGNVGTATLDRAVEDVVPPTIVDLSGTPSTGDSFNFSANFTDNIKLDKCYVVYSFDNGSQQTWRFDGSVGIRVPTPAKVLVYSIICDDVSGNRANMTKVAKVTDNDAPVANDLTILKTKHGDMFSFRAKVSDNIGVSKVYAEYWVGKSKHTVEMSPSGNEYVGTIHAPADVTKFNYTIVAQDAGGNMIRSPVKIVSIEQPGTTIGGTIAVLALLVLLIIVIIVIVVIVLRRRRRSAEPEAVVDEDATDKDREGIRSLDKNEEE